VGCVFWWNQLKKELLDRTRIFFFCYREKTP